MPAQVFVSSHDKSGKKIIHAKINTGLGLGFFLLNFNPDLFTHPFWHVEKKNACRECTE